VGMKALLSGGCRFLIAVRWLAPNPGCVIFCPTGKHMRCVAYGRFKVVFCDTDLVPALETKQGDRTTNVTEAQFIKAVVPNALKLILDCRYITQGRHSSFLNWRYVGLPLTTQAVIAPPRTRSHRHRNTHSRSLSRSRQRSRHHLPRPIKSRKLCR